MSAFWQSFNESSNFHKIGHVEVTNIPKNVPVNVRRHLESPLNGNVLVVWILVVEGKTHIKFLEAVLKISI